MVSLACGYKSDGAHPPSRLKAASEKPTHCRKSSISQPKLQGSLKFPYSYNRFWGL